MFGEDDAKGMQSCVRFSEHANLDAGVQVYGFMATIYKRNVIRLRSILCTYRTVRKNSGAGFFLVNAQQFNYFPERWVLSHVTPSRILLTQYPDEVLHETLVFPVSHKVQHVGQREFGTQDYVILSLIKVGESAPLFGSLLVLSPKIVTRRQSGAVVFT